MGPLGLPHLRKDSLMFVSPAGWDEVICFMFLEIMISILQKKAQTFEKLHGFMGLKAYWSICTRRSSKWGALCEQGFCGPQDTLNLGSWVLTPFYDLELFEEFCPFKEQGLCEWLSPRETCGGGGGGRGGNCSANLKTGSLLARGQPSPIQQKSLPPCPSSSACLIDILIWSFSKPSTIFWPLTCLCVLFLGKRNGSIHKI